MSIAPARSSPRLARLASLTLLLLAAAGCHARTRMNDATYQSFRRARAILDAAVAGHGGVLDADVTARFVGTLADEGHYDVPYAVRSYAWRGVLALRAGGAASRRVQLDGDPVEGQTDCAGGRGRYVAPGTTRPEGDRREVVRQCRALERALPHAVLREAVQRAATLRFIGEQVVGEAACDVIGYVDGDGRAASLVIDRGTHLLARWERLVPHPQLGDTAEWLVFRSYRAIDGLQVPTQIVERWLNEDSAETRDVTLEDIRRGRPLEVSAGEAPASAAGWIGLEAVAPSARATTTVVEIAPELFLVELPDEDVKVLFAVFDDHVIALDAPLRSEAGEAILAEIRRHAPGKPVRYAVFSHHHPHYLGGLRPFIAEGATLVTTPGNVALVRDYARRAHALEPDRLEHSPREAKILAVEKRHVFEDRGHTLELHDIGPATGHTREYLVYYFPRLHVLVEGDLASFPASGEVRRARPGAIGLATAIRELGLDVRTIVQTWPLLGQKRTATRADLEASVAAAAAPETKRGSP
jgi:glyoxylase-like metal-dependent hydrolase (beta-lactamase superfamily II)